MQAKKIHPLSWKEVDDGDDHFITLTIAPAINKYGKRRWSKTYKAQRLESMSKKIVKHQLARAVLNDFVGENWNEINPKDMKGKSVFISSPKYTTRISQQ